MRLRLFCAVLALTSLLQIGCCCWRDCCWRRRCCEPCCQPACNSCSCYSPGVLKPVASGSGMPVETTTYRNVP
jgi:hypothetical protein